LKDEIRGKDEAIIALSETLIEKGDKNRILTEKITEMKNHTMTTQYLNQPFLVQRVTHKGLSNDLLVKFTQLIIVFSSDSYLIRQKNTISSLK
jgi:hypothetical protein